MFKNFLKITLRTLWKNKGQSAILISGLTIGMATCMLLLQYVSYELSFDNQHEKKENIYRVVNERIQNGTSVQNGTITYPTIGSSLKEEFPEIINAARIAYSSDVMLVQADRVEPVEPGLWVDEHFFEIFDFGLITKDGIKILDETNEIVLTQPLADRYFPSAKGDYEAIIGEELQIDRYPEKFKIVGICEKVPANSHLQFELLLSYASCIRYWGEGADNSWTWSDFYHYVELEPGTDATALQMKFTDFSERHFRGDEVSGSEEIFSLQPLSEAHLYSSGLEYEIGETSNGKAIWSLLIVAFFILFIAWINYVNLSSVRAIERAKEVGIRKVIGASKGQLIRQFFTEALLVNFLSLLFALMIVQVLAPWFATNFGVDTSNMAFIQGGQINLYLVIGFVLLMFTGILVSGAYPAWLLSSVHMSNVLKGIFSKNQGGAWLRKGLVVFQFTISIALITATWFVTRQIHFMSHQDLGIDINQVLTINSPEMSAWDSTFIGRMDAFKAELTTIPGVESASTSSRAPGERMGRLFNIQKQGEDATDQSFTSNFIHADFEYAKTYSLHPVAGRYFRAGDHSADLERIDKIVLNEAAVNMLGYEDNEAALGQSLNFWDKSWQIVGVLPNFHQRTLHHTIEPIIFQPLYSTYNQLSLKITGQHLEETLNEVKVKYTQFFPGNTFQYAFVDDYFNRLYESELRFSNILSFFTVLTILIACLGLFGLASYMTFLRTKEIGIRKILGASTIGIISLLTKDFIKLVTLALVIATPFAWYFLNSWLENFAYRIDIEWWVFVLAGLIGIGVAVFTVGLQSIKAALTNPVKSLRSD